jgi:hypothetical protein
VLWKVYVLRLLILLATAVAAAGAQYGRLLSG